MKNEGQREWRVCTRGEWSVDTEICENEGMREEKKCGEGKKSTQKERKGGREK